MTLDTLALTYAFGAGLASFFSPCSTGLLPAYVGYFVSSRSGEPTQNPTPARSLRAGLLLGASASAGFFTLLAAVGLFLWLLPWRVISPVLPYVSIAIGLAIVLLGLFLISGRGLTLRIPHRLTAQSTKSIFTFGFAYALVSLGCTFPLFLSVVLGGASTGQPLTAALSLIVYASGMALVMIAITMALSVSRETATRFLRNAVPVINKVAAAVMVVAGGYIVYYWINVLQQVG